jgi:RNA recognition motif-containing protein
MNIYVGNLSYQVTAEELTELFAEYGEVSTVNVIKDKFTDQSKGFAFVEMARQADAEEAIKVLNGSTLKSRNIKVNQARPQTDRPKRKPQRY